MQVVPGVTIQVSLSGSRYYASDVVAHVPFLVPVTKDPMEESVPAMPAPTMKPPVPVWICYHISRIIYFHLFFIYL